MSDLEPSSLVLQPASGCKFSVPCKNFPIQFSVVKRSQVTRGQGDEKDDYIVLLYIRKKLIHLFNACGKPLGSVRTPFHVIAFVLHSNCLQALGENGKRIMLRIGIRGSLCSNRSASSNMLNLHEANPFKRKRATADVDLFEDKQLGNASRGEAPVVSCTQSEAAILATLETAQKLDESALRLFYGGGLTTKVRSGWRPSLLCGPKSADAACGLQFHEPFFSALCPTLSTSGIFVLFVDDSSKGVGMMDVSVHASSSAHTQTNMRIFLRLRHHLHDVRLLVRPRADRNRPFLAKTQPQGNRECHLRVQSAVAPHFSPGGVQVSAMGESAVSGLLLLETSGHITILSTRDKALAELREHIPGCQRVASSAYVPNENAATGNGREASCAGTLFVVDGYGILHRADIFAGAGRIAVSRISIASKALCVNVCDGSSNVFVYCADGKMVTFEGKWVSATAALEASKKIYHSVSAVETDHLERACLGRDMQSTLGTLFVMHGRRQLMVRAIKKASGKLREMANLSRLLRETGRVAMERGNLCSRDQVFLLRLALVRCHVVLSLPPALGPSLPALPTYHAFQHLVDRPFIRQPGRARRSSQTHSYPATWLSAHSATRARPDGREGCVEVILPDYSSLQNAKAGKYVFVDSGAATSDQQSSALHRGCSSHQHTSAQGNAFRYISLCTLASRDFTLERIAWGNPMHGGIVGPTISGVSFSPQQSHSLAHVADSAHSATAALPPPHYSSLLITFLCRFCEDRSDHSLSPALALAKLVGKDIPSDDQQQTTTPRASCTLQNCFGEATLKLQQGNVEPQDMRAMGLGSGEGGAVCFRLSIQGSVGAVQCAQARVSRQWANIAHSSVCGKGAAAVEESGRAEGRKGRSSKGKARGSAAPRKGNKPRGRVGRFNNKAELQATALEGQLLEAERRLEALAGLCREQEHRDHAEQEVILSKCAVELRTMALWARRTAGDTLLI